MKNFCSHLPRVMPLEQGDVKSVSLQRTEQEGERGGYPQRSEERRHSLPLWEGKGTSALASPQGTEPVLRGCSEITPRLLLHLPKASATPSAGADPDSAPANIPPPREELPLQHPARQKPNCSRAGHQHHVISPFPFSPCTMHVLTSTLY